jgi:hypothetical protein
MSVTGASASSGPSETRDDSVVAQDQWNFEGYFSNGAKCDESRRDKYAKDLPTQPTTGCYRVPNGYYYLWWGSYWDG